jgi:Co/Zn/Cd efflux system component
MSAHCCGPAPSRDTAVSSRFRRVLWIALAVNLAMFVVEVAASLKSGSVSLLADSVDFAGDAANYGLTLAVLSMGLAWRSRAAWVKGLSMAAFGVAIVGKTAWSAIVGIPPDPLTMGAVAVLALAANVGVAALLYSFREGDANMRSVWLCSRNDAIGNVAVMLAAAGVVGTGSGWPDLIFAAIMAALALSSGIAVMRMATGEIRQSAPFERAMPAPDPHGSSR